LELLKNIDESPGFCSSSSINHLSSYFLISFRRPFFTNVNRRVFPIREQFLYMITLSSIYYRLVYSIWFRIFASGFISFRLLCFRTRKSQALSGCYYCFCKIVQFSMSIFHEFNSKFISII